ncbi:MAG: hypothetical protein HXS54_06810 [Theionarchaea archaeon]|nr:hypothetical protein [Theionarchaea archaeon]
MEADTKYTVRVEAEGYYQEEVIIHIEKGMKKYIKFNMEKKASLTMKIKELPVNLYNMFMEKFAFIDNLFFVRLAAISSILTLVGSILAFIVFMCKRLYRFLSQSKSKKES